MSSLKPHWIWRLLKKILMPFRIILAISLTSLISCASIPHGKPISSLCILDFEARMCWVDKAHGQGFTFEDMTKEDSVSWFGLNQFDLERIHDKLNE